MTEKFFIIGSQRSGTTLMRLILDSHPEIVCLDEPDSYEVAVGQMPLPEAALVGLKTPVWTQHFPDSPPYYSDEKIIFMVRGVEDTIASMLDLELGGIHWTDSWLLPAMGNKLANPEFRGKWEREIALAGDDVVGLAALFWKEKMQALDYLPQAYAVGYEELVASPSKVLHGVCDYLGVKWNTSLLKHHLVAHAGEFPDGTTVGGTVVSKPIHKGSVGHGKKLNPEQLALIKSIIEEPVT